MNKYEAEITPYAKGQMEEIRDYIKYQLKNPDAARNLLLEMKDQIKKLEYIADSIKPIDEQPWGSQGVKKISVKNFYLYFWTDKKRRNHYEKTARYWNRGNSRIASDWFGLCNG